MAEKIIREPFELYGGKIKGEFLPKSHRYYILEKDGKKLEKKYIPSSVTSISGLVDKSRVLMGWAVRQYTERVNSLMSDGVNFTADDVLSMLKVGEGAHTERKEFAAGIGDYVHQFCEEYAKDTNAEKAHDRMVAELGKPSEEMAEKINNGVQGFVKWIEKEKIKIIEAEQITYSMQNDFIGKFDAIMETPDKERYLADYKTSNGIYNEHYYQLSAYLKAKEEETGEKFDGAMIIAIAKEDKEDKDGNIIKKAGEITVEMRTRMDLVKDFKAFKGLIDLKIREKELQAEWRIKNKIK